MRVPRDLNDPEIGGRYSALSHFGLVPAALIGADLPRLLDGAAEMARECSIEDPGENPGARLGAVLGAMAGERRDKLTLLAEPAFEPLGVWVEQLVAESTGKSGEGILPVEGEPPGDPAAYGDDRLFVYTGAQTPSELEAIGLAGHPVVRLAAREPYELGGEMFRWMFATAVAGHRLGINPFDQPNVESAKVLARKMVAEYRERGALPEPEPALRDGRVSVYGSGAACTAGGGAGGVPLPGQARGLRRATGLRAALESGGRRTAGAAVAGAGPAASGDHGGLRAALLHSTGQLHKGDGGNGLFLQFTADTPQDTPIPDEAGADDSSLAFGALVAAQALGDLQALQEAGRRVLRFHFGGEDGDAAGAIRSLADGL